MKSFRIMFGFVALLSMFSVNAKQQEFRPVVDFFNALAKVEGYSLDTVVSDDFVLLENGELWNTAKLKEELGKSKIKSRRNFFHIISTVKNDDMALVNYWNKAIVELEDRTVTLVWLESAVVTHSEGDWHLRQLHSTRILESKLPKDVTLEEMK
ncbi:hypothetical protein [Thalassotalea agarivorans]|uniref:SnoaL-like domain-containing protein n=1 Tax=Thalassotalea agarivorans TaxID=349064 RepID=A0A1H9ZFL9_THASX|nr:hypothetical protein [Thalassotalea agarivorans]SES80395.1 hypothetical protein SAMN05660429_00432 [Thalassotalea agarivorans]